MIDIRTGNTLTSESPEAAKLYQQAVDLILGSESGADVMLDKALALDKDFTLAAAARYYVAKNVGKPDAQVYKALAEQTALNTTDWEREHVDILIGLIERPSESKVKALAYIKTSPADLLVISQLTGNMLFYGGPTKLESVLNVLESVQEALGDDWAFLARLGFAASEAGQYQRGRALLERALELRPQSLYTIHGLAHMLHDDGAAEESAKILQDWLNKYESSAREGQMYGHVQWHLALAEWQMGDRDAAMQRYLEFSAPVTTTCGPILTLADCGGFLLRNYLQSGQVTALGKDVVEHIERVWRMMGHPFVALHVAGLYATAGDIAGLKRCEEIISVSSTEVNRDVSLALVSSLSDLVTGNYQRATQTLATVSTEARIGIGGSNVERILVELIEARCKMQESRRT
jgi:tetratricopeptide (TPR) repeat protein